MRIALLTDGIYPFSVGGMQKHSFYMAKSLAQKGVEVDLYYSALKEPAEEELLSLFSETEKKKLSFFFFAFPETAKIPGHYLRASYRYSCALAKHILINPSVDFIYAQGFCAWELIRLKKSGNNSLPPVGVNFHGLEMFQNIPGLRNKTISWMFKKPVKYNLSGADVIFSLGGNLTRIINKITRGQKKIVQIPVGIGDNWLGREGYNKQNTEPEKRKFAFIGRYENRKGHDLVNKCLNRLLKNKKHNDRFIFEFAGDIPENKKIVAGNIIYHGLIKDEKVIKKILSGSDVLLCPSYAEGMPTVILEAMACGNAIIATDVGAISELVSNENGWLISPGNDDVLYNTMLEAIICEKKLLGAMQLASEMKIKSGYGWSHVAETTYKEINNCLNFSK